MQDKIIIYNELIDVMRSIYYIFLTKRYESLTNDKDSRVKDKDEAEPQKNQDLNTAIGELEGKIDDILLGDDEANDIIEGYTMHNDILLEAWAHFRPNLECNDPPHGRTIDSNDGEKRKPHKAGEGFFDPDFITKLMANMCLKIYMDTKTD